MHRKYISKTQIYGLISTERKLAKEIVDTNLASWDEVVYTMIQVKNRNKKARKQLDEWLELLI